MKKQLTSAALLVAAALSSRSATAQDTAGQQPPRSGSARSFIGITGGLSTPGGNFAKSDYADNTAGYGGNGGNVGITGVYFFGRSTLPEPTLLVLTNRLTIDSCSISCSNMHTERRKEASLTEKFAGDDIVMTTGS